MPDFARTKTEAHRANIARYSRMLATPLTERERAFVHKRIAEERAELERLEAQNSRSDWSWYSPLKADVRNGDAGTSGLVPLDVTA